MQIVSVMIRADDGSEFEVPLKTALELFEALKSIVAPEEVVEEMAGLDQDILAKIKESYPPLINNPPFDLHPSYIKKAVNPVWQHPTTGDSTGPIYGGTISPASMPDYPSSSNYGMYNINAPINFGDGGEKLEDSDKPITTSGVSNIINGGMIDTILSHLNPDKDKCADSSD